MRVLILSQYFWPETFRINEIALSLQRLGCKVTVLTGQPNYPGGKVFPGYRAWRAGREGHSSGCTIFRVPIAPRGSATAIRLVANYLSFVINATFFGAWLMRGQKFDVIFVYGISPILQAIPGILLKRSKGAALITWVQDLWPQSLEATGFFRNRRLLSYVEVVVRWIYRHSELILVQSQSFIPLVEALACGSPVRYQPNPGELSFETPTQDQPVLVFEPGFNVVFAGNLGTVQALDTVLDAAELLMAYPDVRIVLIGSGSRESWLMQETARRSLRNVRFSQRMPPEAMPAIFSQASALLVSLIRNPIMNQTIPSKVQAYLAAGRPIIACLDGEGARVIQESGAGAACPAEDAPALAKAILRLRDAPKDDLQRMGEAGRCYYRQHFDSVLLAEKLIGHFKDAASRRLGSESGSVRHE